MKYYTGPDSAVVLVHPLKEIDFAWSNFLENRKKSLPRETVMLASRGHLVQPCDHKVMTIIR